MRVSDERIEKIANSRRDASTDAEDLLGLIAEECRDARYELKISMDEHERTITELKHAEALIEKKEAELTALRAYIATHNAPVHDPLRQYWVHRGPCGEDGCH